MCKLPDAARAALHTVAVALSLLACGGPSRAPAPAPAPAVEVPRAAPAPPTVAELVERIDVPAASLPVPAAVHTIVAAANLRQFYDRLLGYAGRVQPDAVALTWETVTKMLAEQGIDLSGADLTRPAWLLVLDERAASLSLVIVTRVADQDRLRRTVDAIGAQVLVRDGWAVIGSLAALQATAPWALSTLVHDRPGPGLTSIVPQGALTALWPRISAALGAHEVDPDPDVQAAARLTHDLLEHLLPRSSGVTLRLTVEGDVLLAEVIAGVDPDSALAASLRQVEPATFEVLPAFEAAPLIVAGRVDVTARSLPLYRSALPFHGLGDDDRHWADQWAQLASGEMALAMHSPDVDGIVFEYQTRDPEALRRLRKQQLPDDYERNVARHRGVQLDREPVATMPGHVWSAGLADRLTYASGATGRKRIEARIDALKEPATAPPWLQAAEIRARDRGETLLMLIDVWGLLPWGGLPNTGEPGSARVEVGLQLSAEGCALRVRLPANQSRAMVLGAPLLQ